MNNTARKNELILEYSSGMLGEAKSILISTYLHLNSVASKNASVFDNLLAEDLFKLNNTLPKKLKYTDCITSNENSTNTASSFLNPLSKIVGNLNNINWKSVYKGFKEFDLPANDKDKIKLIKMDAGTSVPLHSHSGKEYILVIDGSFCDEYGEYKKGDLQINDHNIKHHPTACNDNGCICLSITENDVIFYGPFAPILNLFTFIKSFFKQN
jgi:putative transcriptional regulator